MPTSRRSPHLTSRRAATATVTLVLAAIAVGGVVAPSAVSVPKTNKITICHRTHAVTNPYRMITVSASAADGAGRNDHTSHDLTYEFEGTTYPIFDPSISYPSNDKNWGDIIPPVRNGDGLNWTAANAQAIYTGTGDFFGLCGRLSAKQYFDLEVAAGVDPAEVLADLDEQSSLDDEALKDDLGIDDFSELDPSDLPEDFGDTPPAPGGARPPASFGPVPGKQTLTVYVWFDLDSDGTADDGELPATGVTVSLGAVVDVASAGYAAPATLVMAAGDYLTDANGLVTVDTIDAGQWEVTATPPADTTVTFDSEGTPSDGAAQIDVPASSAGFGWIGLMPAEDPTDGGGGDSGGGTGDGGGDSGGGGDTGGGTDDDNALAGDQLASTGMSPIVATLSVVATALLALGLTLFALVRSARRRVSAR